RARGRRCAAAASRSAHAQVQRASVRGDQAGRALPGARGDGPGGEPRRCGRARGADRRRVRAGRRGAAGGGPGDDVTAARASILIVDDDAINRMLLTRNLERAGHRVASAEDGVRALEALRAEPFDIVLLDVLMPELDGYD